ncbi:MAG: threonine--tRNA ligase [Candidatus Pacebacteria bacterium]|nr:threonine--tRNA ligase [Candidatus Paceibacterota bacterium]
MKDLQSVRHTLAHVLAAAVLTHDPKVKIAIGPAIENGFYYDFEFSKGKIPGEGDLKSFEKEMHKILKKGFEPECQEVSVDEARELFKDQPYKLELIEGIAKEGENITTYTIGEFVDLCEGPHVASSSEVDLESFALSHVAGAYWRGDEKNPMLTRIYGLAFENKEALDAYLAQQEEAKARDHRKLGKELDLFTFSDLVGPGLPLFTPRGTLMRDLIVDKIMSIQERFGYTKVSIPHITKSDLYKTSGHWDKFGDELFKVRGKSDTEFVMKPMNCPHHTQIFDSRPRSYKELPLRFAETTMVYRDEQQGELLGLSRVRSITQDDGHVFCTFEQIRQEVENIVHVIKEFYTSLDMFQEGKFWVSLSVRDPDEPEKYLGDAAGWDKAESVLEDIAKQLDLPYKRVEGEAAFYGPKLDFMFFDALGRERQLATAQLDFVMPERFTLSYVDENGEKKTPVMIHRAIAGSLERFMAIMIEHFAGAFPLWLSPVQIKILPISENHTAYAKEVAEQLKASGIRLELDDSSESLGKKIRNTKLEKVPYFLVIGEQEVDKKEVTLESRDEGKVGSMSVEDLTARLKAEINPE